MKLREAVFHRLASSPGEKFTARQLAEWLVANHPEEAARKLHASRLTTPSELLTQLVAEIAAGRPQWEAKHPELKTTADRPRRYYWSSETDEIAAAAADAGTANIATGVPQLSENALYPMVSQFLASEFGVVSKRIDERTASNKRGVGGNKWLFPDVCGLQDLISSLHGDVKSLVDVKGDRKAFLWSLEVKIVLNSSNVRECFFQAVSNSSWANFGYLVAAQIDDRALSELRMMHGLHGIGLIQLDTFDPAESQVLIPAKLRPSVDWLAFSRLATECADFRAYSKLVRSFHLTNEVSAADWAAQRFQKVVR